MAYLQCSTDGCEVYHTLAPPEPLCCHRGLLTTLPDSRPPQWDGR